MTKENFNINYSDGKIATDAKLSTVEGIDRYIQTLEAVKFCLYRKEEIETKKSLNKDHIIYDQAGKAIGISVGPNGIGPCWMNADGN